jgi:hypothetical protein
MRHLSALILASAAHAPPDGSGVGSGALERLGTIKPIDDAAAVADLNRTLEAHRAAILEVAGDSQRKIERIDRMLPEMQAKVDKVKAGARAEYVPGGDVGALEARYARLDGAVQLGRVVEKIELPDGSIAESPRDGLLTERYPVTREHKVLTDAYRSYALAHRVFGPDHGHPLVRKSFLAFRRAAHAMPGRTGDFLRTMMENRASLQRVIGNSAGIGAELVATPTIADIRRPTDLARSIAGLVQVVEAPGRTFKQPQVTGRAISRLRGATSNDPARYPVQTFTTAETSITVRDRVINVLLDDNFVDEAALVLPDPMGFVMDWIEQGDADSLENAFINGDTAATHQDTLSTWTVGGFYTAGDLDGSQSPLKLFLGFRARAHDDSNTTDTSGSFDADDHFAALNNMGNLAAGAVMMTGLDTFYSELLASSLFTSVDKFGPAATLLTGTLGAVGSTPIVISQFIRKEFASTGLYTGSGSTGIVVYANPAAWVHYSHAGTNGDWDVSYPEKGARYVGIKRSSILTTRCLSTEKPVAILRNL